MVSSSIFRAVLRTEGNINRTKVKHAARKIFYWLSYDYDGFVNNVALSTYHKPGSKVTLGFLCKDTRFNFQQEEQISTLYHKKYKNKACLTCYGRYKISILKTQGKQIPKINVFVSSIMVLLKTLLVLRCHYKAHGCLRILVFMVTELLTSEVRRIDSCCTFDLHLILYVFSRLWLEIILGVSLWGIE